ncbi:type IV toxin-antitoxin system AbiEi family antitoxin [Fodinibius sp.]|uniref:type IV toxin-antitoxin system AbiEi family antitoxin n=1 Tax=Fodinibius sp. TaxID=1872440 RepID=UPI00356A9AE1
MEADILPLAQENLEKLTQFKLEIEEREKYIQDVHQVDAKVKLHLPDETLDFFAEIKKEVRTHQLPRIYELAKTNKPFLLIGGQIFPNIKEKLKNKGINWIDGAGNMYIRTKDHFLFVDHNETFHVKVERDRAFTKTGLKVVFLFLLDEEWIQKTYREIAEAADVALGTIGYVINGLKKRKYLVKKDEKNYQLVRKDALIDEWIGAYEQELKPKLHKGTFAFIDKEEAANWKKMELDDQTVWGGEAGADLLTGMLKPQDLTLFTTHTKGNIMKKFRLKPDPDGTIQVYEPFWSIEKGKETAPPLAIYADLILTGDERNFKIAEKIYGEFIQD